MNIKTTTWKLIKKFANLNLAIALLLIIAISSIAGTIIEQNQPVSHYQLHYPIREQAWQFNWKYILSIGLDHVYITWWFLLILMLFFCSLITCTFSNQLPSLKNARKWKFLESTKAMKKFQEYKQLPIKSSCNIIYSLTQANYYVFHRKNSLYGHKGLIGKVAPIFVHISIIVTLLGSLIGLLQGIYAQEMIPNGEIFHIQNLVRSGVASSIPNNIIGRVDKFNIEYNSDNSIKQFISTISLFDNELNLLVRKNISVNKPLSFKGITLYQTDWQINALRFIIDSSEIIEQSLNKIKDNTSILWACSLPIGETKSISIVIPDLQGDILIYDNNGLLLTKTALNQEILINGIPLTIKEIMTSTGLQVKTDPGIVLVYPGFALMMLSIMTSYLSYSQIWVSVTYSSTELCGRTNRALLTFEEDFEEINDMYISLSQTKI